MRTFYRKIVDAMQMIVIGLIAGATLMVQIVIEHVATKFADFE